MSGSRRADLVARILSRGPRRAALVVRPSSCGPRRAVSDCRREAEASFQARQTTFRSKFWGIARNLPRWVVLTSFLSYVPRVQRERQGAAPRFAAAAICDLSEIPSKFSSHQ